MNRLDSQSQLISRIEYGAHLRAFLIVAKQQHVRHIIRRAIRAVFKVLEADQGRRAACVVQGLQPIQACQSRSGFALSLWRALLARIQLHTALPRKHTSFGAPRRGLLERPLCPRASKSQARVATNLAEEKASQCAIKQSCWGSRVSLNLNFGPTFKDNIEIQARHEQAHEQYFCMAHTVFSRGKCCFQPWETPVARRKHAMLDDNEHVRRDGQKL